MDGPMPQDPVGRAEALLELRRPEEALRAALEAIGENPEDPWAHFVAGRAHLTLERPEAAQEHGREMIRIDPENPHGHLLVGETLLAADPVGAEAAYLECARLAPDQAWPHERLAAALANRGDPRSLERARQACVRSLSIDPRYRLALVRLGVVFAGLERPREAMELYLASLALAPEDPAVHRNRGFLLQGMGLYAEAAGAFEEALRRHPDDRDVQEAYESLGAERYRIGRAISWPYRLTRRAATALKELILRVVPGRPSVGLHVVHTLHILFLLTILPLTGAALVVILTVEPGSDGRFLRAGAIVYLGLVTVVLVSIAGTTLLRLAFWTRWMWRTHRTELLWTSLAVGVVAAIQVVVRLPAEARARLLPSFGTPGEGLRAAILIVLCAAASFGVWKAFRRWRIPLVLFAAYGFALLARDPKKPAADAAAIALSVLAVALLLRGAFWMLRRERAGSRRAREVDAAEREIFDRDPDPPA